MFTVPVPVRYQLAFDAGLTRAVLRVFLRVVFTWQRRRAIRRGLVGAGGMFLTVGTSAVVYPAASLIEEARRRGAYTVEINLEPMPASNFVDIAVQGSAEHVLAEIDRRLKADARAR